MTDTTDIKALREASRRATFENQAAQHEKCSLSFIISLRNKKGGYSNEKIDDMWYGFKLAVAPPWGRTVGEVAIESNRLFHEKKALLDKLEAERQRADALDSSETQLIQERDSAEAALSDMYEAATGHRPEWSNMFQFADAVEDVEAELAALKAKLANPVVLSDCSFEAVSHMAHWYSKGECVAWVSGAEHVKKQILEAGFKVKGE